MKNLDGLDRIEEILVELGYKYSLDEIKIQQALCMCGHMRFEHGYPSSNFRCHYTSNCDCIRFRLQQENFDQMTVFELKNAWYDRTEALLFLEKHQC